MTRSPQCIRKLAALSETIDTWLVTPNGDHLWEVMKRSNTPDCLDFDTFPESNPKSYGRSNWERELRAEGFLGDAFDTLHTYGSLNRSKIDLETDDRQHKIAGHA